MTGEREKVANLLRLTNSFEVTLIPDSQRDIEKKNFAWTVEFVGEDSIEFKFDFENPDYISMGDRADYISIKFLNTPLFLIPTDKEKNPVPNGWEITTRLPPMKPAGIEGEILE